MSVMSLRTSLRVRAPPCGVCVRLRHLSVRPLNEAVVNVPNALSLSRILVAPGIAMSIVNHEAKLAVALFTFAAVTDVVDGWWARRFNQQTVVGSFLDPMSDKIMTIFVASALGHVSLLSPWAVGLLVAKDVCLMLGTVVVRVRAVRTLNPVALFNVRDLPATRVAPSVAGKFAATTVAALLGTALLESCLPGTLASLGCPSTLAAGEINSCIRTLEYVAVGSTLGASFHYLYHWRRTFPKV